jgi:hypothetical protein
LRLLPQEHLHAPREGQRQGLAGGGRGHLRMATQQAQETCGEEEERGTAKGQHNPLIISDGKGHHAD